MAVQQSDGNAPGEDMRPWQRVILCIMKAAAIYLVLVAVMLLLHH